MVSISKRRIVHLLLYSIAILTLASIAGQICKYWLGIPEARGLVRLFYLDAEGNIPSWYQSMTLLLSSVLLFAVSAGERVRRNQDAERWRGLAVIFLLMSIDEAASVHEMMGDFMHDRLNTHGPLFFSWVICGAAFVAAMAVAYGPFLWRLPLRTRLSFLLAGALYVGGTIGMDILQGPYAEHHGQWNMTFSMMATVEEVMEMSGVLVFIEALLAHLKNQGGRSCFRIVD